MALRIRVPCPAARMTTRGALAMWREYTDALALDLPRFRTRRARAGQTLYTIFLLGSRQVVRQRTLDPPLEGSNPSSPANLRPVRFLIGTRICLIGRGPRSIKPLLLGATNVAPLCASRTVGVALARLLSSREANRPLVTSLTAARAFRERG